MIYLDISRYVEYHEFAVDEVLGRMERKVGRRNALSRYIADFLSKETEEGFLRDVYKGATRSSVQGGRQGGRPAPAVDVQRHEERMV